MRNTRIQRQMRKRPIRQDRSATEITLDEDYITNVSGEKMLENRSFCCATFGDYPLISIKVLGFIGTATQLLRKHGLLYFKMGVNALRIEEALTKRARLQLGLGA